MTAREILIKARGYIESGWCRDHYAVNPEGSPCRANSGEAVAWCALGALRAADQRGDDLSPEGYAAKALLNEVVGDIIWWNDSRAHAKEEVLAAFDKAIELASQEDVRA